MVFAVELFEAAWQRISDGHGIEQAAAGKIKGVEPGNDPAEHGDRQKDQPHLADQRLHSRASWPAAVVDDELLPWRHNRSRDVHDHVHECRHTDRADEQHASLFVGEGIFLRSLRDAAEADERPWRQRRHREDRSQRRFVRCEERHQVGPLNTAGEDDRCDDAHRPAETEGDSSAKPAGRFHAAHIDEPNENDGQNGDKQLTAVHRPAGDLIKRPGLQRTRENIAGNQPNGSAVHWDQRPIGEGEKPTADKCVGLAKNSVGVNKFAAGDRILADQIAVTETDDDDHRRPNDEAKRSADRTGVRQKGIARHDEASPADHCTQGKGPNAKEAETLLEMCVLLRHRFYSFACASEKRAFVFPWWRTLAVHTNTPGRGGLYRTRPAMYSPFLHDLVSNSGVLQGESVNLVAF